MKRLFVTGLVHLYPSLWRDEYGSELGELLMRRRLGIRAVLDVFASAAWQQCRLQQPWLLIGVPLALWISVAIGYAFGNPGGVSFTGGNVSLPGIAIFAGVGFWTVRRFNRAGGRAAMKLSLLVTFPFVIVGLLVMTGAAPMPFSGLDGRADAFRMFVIGPVLQPLYAGTLGWAGGLAGRLSRRLG